MAYVYRETYRQDSDTYIENRGYPYIIHRGDEDFDIVDEYFGEMLEPGNSAIHTPTGEWAVVEGSPYFETTKKKKLQQLKSQWLRAEEEGKVEATDIEGNKFLIDANPRAMRDITGVILKMKKENISQLAFCAADNTFHTVTLAELENMQISLVDLGQALYSKKWAMRSAIEAATTFEELDAIHISFED